MQCIDCWNFYKLFVSFSLIDLLMDYKMFNNKNIQVKNVMKFSNFYETIRIMCYQSLNFAKI